jgi:hypothetical protein
MPVSKELYQDEKTGLWLEREIKFEKKDKMTRDEWRAYFAQEEISEQEFRDEYSKYKRPLDS